MNVKKNCDICDICVILNRDNRALQAQLAEKDKQIEKMKCCGNCIFDGQNKNASYEYYSRCVCECKNHSLWVMKK